MVFSPSIYYRIVLLYGSARHTDCIIARPATHDETKMRMERARSNVTLLQNRKYASTSKYLLDSTDVGTSEFKGHERYVHPPASNHEKIRMVIIQCIHVMNRVVILRDFTSRLLIASFPNHALKYNKIIHDILNSNNMCILHKQVVSLWKVFTWSTHKMSDYWRVDFMLSISVYRID
jgi:hypothetical protein